MRAQILTGWPRNKKELDIDLKPFFDIRDELVLDGDLIYKGRQLVIPTEMCATYVKKVHEGHVGAEAAVRRAQEVMYCPNMRQDIHTHVSACQTCKMLKPH